MWAPLIDPEASTMIHTAMQNHGVRLLPQTTVKELLGSERVKEAVLSTSETIAAELVIVGIGMNYSLSWLRSAGITCHNGIVTNEFLETSQPQIWAAGDCAEYKDLLLEEQVQMGNWINAQAQGMHVGQNMTGQRIPFKKVSFYKTTGFGITISFIGDVRALPGRSTTLRVNDNKSRVRFVIEKNEIVGATLVNAPAELGWVIKLIETNRKVLPIEKELADPQYPLQRLFAN